MKKNILFILLDQYRYDAISYTNGYMKTPYIDNICENGILFSNCITVSPVCIPARLGLATSLYPSNANTTNNIPFTLNPITGTWMKAIEKGGYNTALIGKTHLHHQKGNLRKKEYLLNLYGYKYTHEIPGPRAMRNVNSYIMDKWKEKNVYINFKNDINDRLKNKPWIAKASTLPNELYYDNYIEKETIKYLDNYKENKPWCLHVCFSGPHEPWDAPGEYATMYDYRNMPKPIKKPDWVENSKISGELFERIMTEKNEFEKDDIAKLKANYGGNVTLIDNCIGNIINKIKERKELDNTIIIISSDHGEHNGDYGLLYKKTFLDSAVRIPLIISTPNGVKKYKSDYLCSLLDIGITILDLVGIKPYYNHFGKSLKPIINNTNMEDRKYIVSELKDEYMIMTKEMKAFFNKKKEIYILFKIGDETTNLTNLKEFKNIKIQLTNYLIEHITSIKCLNSNNINICKKK